MCLVSKPKIAASTSSTDPSSNKPLPVIRNPILDGLIGNIAASRAGTNAFRIDLANPLTIPTSNGSGGSSAGGSSSGGASTSGGSSTSGSFSGSTPGASFSGGGGSRAGRVFQ